MVTVMKHLRPYTRQEIYKKLMSLAHCMHAEARENCVADAPLISYSVEAMPYPASLNIEILEKDSCREVIILQISGFPSP